MKDQFMRIANCPLEGLAITIHWDYVKDNNRIGNRFDFKWRYWGGQQYLGLVGGIGS